jgi:hypothetical protein
MFFVVLRDWYTSTVRNGYAGRLQGSCQREKPRFPAKRTEAVAQLLLDRAVARRNCAREPAAFIRNDVRESPRNTQNTLMRWTPIVAWAHRYSRARVTRPFESSQSAFSRVYLWLKVLVPQR